MKKYVPYPTRDAIKNYFPLPNEIFDFGLHSTAIAIYAYLMKLENRDDYTCFPNVIKLSDFRINHKFFCNFRKTKLDDFGEFSQK